MKEYNFWFLCGTQSLYGNDIIEKVNKNAQTMTRAWNESENIPSSVKWIPAVKDSESILKVILEANMDENCAGIITWMHTFSPSKMWIAGLTQLTKPYLHLNTQFTRDIPWDSIDMEYMNLNQSAHGDREHGFISTRLRMRRKVIAGYWESPETMQRIGDWMRSAVGAVESKKTKICRFGDNMRHVAVTEGDKVEAQIKLGWSVSGFGVGDLIDVVDHITEEEINMQMIEYESLYDIATPNIDAVRYQAKMEIAIKKFMDQKGFSAFTNTFEDLQSLRQLPGLATQNLMRKGYGYGGEGDWKTAALCRIMKNMAQNLPGGTAFMEDYTYHLEPGNEAILGAHMLEVDPVIAVDRPKIEVYPLGIGDREPPARLTFSTGAGPAIVVCLVDLGDRFRMIINDVDACVPFFNMPNLPVAQVMWKPLPNLSTSAEAWILAGGSHHTVMSYQLNATHMRDFCHIMGIECIHINQKTDITTFERDLLISESIWKKQ